MRGTQHEQHPPADLASHRRQGRRLNRPGDHHRGGRTALAASESTEPPPVIVEGLSHGSRCQGNNEVSEGKGYRVFLAVQPTDAPAPVLNSAVNGSGDVQTYAAGPTPVPNKPGVYEYLVLGESSSNWLTINYTFAGSDPQEVTISTRPQCSDYQF